MILKSAFFEFFSGSNLKSTGLKAMKIYNYYPNNYTYFQFVVLYKLLKELLIIIKLKTFVKDK